MMRVIVVDDENFALENMRYKLSEIDDVKDIKTFISPAAAIEYLKEEPTLTDIAFLDINMGSVNGLMLAKEIKEISPSVAIIFVTGYQEYAVDAFKLKASGYLLKPASVDDIREEINHIKDKMQIEEQNLILVQAFGNFEVFCGGRPIVFSRKKSKEAFAYLIDRRGAEVEVRELAMVLYESKVWDKSLKSLIQTIVADMVHTIKQIDSSCIIKKRNSIAVDVKRVKCDFYDFLNGNISAVNAYRGEYMHNYSWAEFTTAYLSNKMN